MDLQFGLLLNHRLFTKGVVYGRYVPCRLLKHLSCVLDLNRGLDIIHGLMPERIFPIHKQDMLYANIPFPVSMLWRSGLAHARN
jgi:hypothetical protein